SHTVCKRRSWIKRRVWSKVLLVGKRNRSHSGMRGRGLMGGSARLIVVQHSNVGLGPHPGGMSDNSPAFQRWGGNRPSGKVPAGTTESQARSDQTLGRFLPSLRNLAPNQRMSQP